MNRFKLIVAFLGLVAGCFLAGIGVTAKHYGNDLGAIFMLIGSIFSLLIAHCGLTTYEPETDKSQQPQEPPQ